MNAKHSATIKGLRKTLSPGGIAVLVAGLTTGVGALAGQTPLPDSPAASYVTVEPGVTVLANLTLIDGTAGPVLRDQSIVIRDDRIVSVGPASETQIPPGARVLDLEGHTVMPGMVGLHNHLFYMAAGGRMNPMSYTGQRLYLGSGVTTIRTTGSLATYAELNLKDEIERGLQPGPRIHITAPYMTGDESLGIMTRLRDAEQARRFVRYWAAEGATWLKAYTTIRTDELAAAIDEAHKVGLKVTGHLCSISFTEAVDLGIDNIEHGLATNSDYAEGKVKDVCPADLLLQATAIDVHGAEAQNTFRKMIDADVAMTSTLAVYELSVQGRPTRDRRTLNAMAPDVREDYLAAKARIDEIGRPEDGFLNAMAYEKAFYDAGGLLAAGVDPTGNGGALPGYGDQRNYELFIEAGFTPTEAVQVLSANGARVLGVFDDLGTVEEGKLADLVVLRGDLTADPAVVREVTLVFKDGVGYDAPRMLADTEGRVGIN